MTRVVLTALLITAAVAPPGCTDEPDVAPNDPGERRGPTLGGVERTVKIDTSLVLLPLAKRLQARLGEKRAGLEFKVDTTDTRTAFNASA